MFVAFEEIEEKRKRKIMTKILVRDEAGEDTFFGIDQIIEMGSRTGCRECDIYGEMAFDHLIIFVKTKAVSSFICLHLLIFV